MSKNVRIPVPRALAAEILVSSDRTCCVCRQPGKSLQLHHIDGNPGNNDPRNIAVLCLQCHDETQLTGGFGRRLDALTVARYRDIWLADVEKRRASAIDLDEPATPAEAAQILERYATTFRRTYTRSEELVRFDCRLDNASITSADVPALLQKETNLLLRGPSGSGKTSLSLQAAVDHTRRGVAILFPVKHYSGRLDSDLDREVRLLDVPSTSRLLSAARKLGRPTLLIVDGYNECDVGMRESLAVELAAWIRRYPGSLLVSSRITPERDDLLALRTVHVLQATMTTKTTIAANVMGVDVLPEGIEQLLRASASGLEASIVGHVGRETTPRGSRFSLFDAYARARLSDAEIVGIRALSNLAGWLSERMAFSLSVREFDRLLDRMHLPHALSHRLQEAGLISAHGDKVSFAHEMFFDVFAADAAVHDSAGRPERLLKALTAPVNAGRKDLILGTMDDPLLREKVLPALSDPECIAPCITGSCGGHARTWAHERCLGLLDRMRDEASNARLEFRDSDRSAVVFDDDALHEWEPADRAFINAFHEVVAQGKYIDAVLEIVATLDRRIDEECGRLRDDTRSRSYWRDRIFHASFHLGFEPCPAIATICSGFNRNVLITSGNRDLATSIAPYFERKNLTAGQLLLLLALARSAWNLEQLARIIVPFLAWVLPAQPADLPGSLATRLLGEATWLGMAGVLSDAETETLRLAAESLPSSHGLRRSFLYVDALKALGALEQAEKEHAPVARKEVQRCLANRDDKESHVSAYDLYTRQFDHPYSDAYCEVFRNLADPDRKALLVMAVRGAKPYLPFTDWLITELSAFDDPDIGRFLLRFTGPPALNEVFYDDAIGVFVNAHATLAGLRYPLPDDPREDDEPLIVSLLACGLMYYWVHRKDLGESARRSRCENALDILFEHCFTGALAALCQCENSPLFQMARFSDRRLSSLVDFLPDRIVDLCRRALSRRAEIVPLRFFGRDDGVAYAIDVLGRHGSSADTSLLRRCGHVSELGTRAISAMKLIERREDGWKDDGRRAFRAPDGTGSADDLRQTDGNSRGGRRGDGGQ